MNNIQERFEQMINDLAISNKKETYLKEQINFFFNILKKLDKNRMIMSNSYFDLDLNPTNYILDKFYYGGSFDRGVYINKQFDIDIYFVFKGDSRFTSNDDKQKLELVAGKTLFCFLKRKVSSFDYRWRILKEPPYFHAIPIQLFYLDQKQDVDAKLIILNEQKKIDKQKESEQYQKIFVDCVPSIETPSNFLIIPNGEIANKKVNPRLEQEAISRINKKHNGKATKLIRLIKAWNYYNDKPLKSYLIERLVEKVFDNMEITDWASSLKTFFIQTSYILKTNDHIPDRVYNQNSILNEYSQDQRDKYYNAVYEASLYAYEGKWEQLFKKKDIIN